MPGSSFLCELVRIAYRSSTREGKAGEQDFKVFLDSITIPRSAQKGGGVGLVRGSMLAEQV